MPYRKITYQEIILITINWFHIHDELDREKYDAVKHVEDEATINTINIVGKTTAYWTKSDYRLFCKEILFLIKKETNFFSLD